ncbi:MAG: putative sulfate exporter family transporter [bacterium]|nr:putative sulfate exporter family transporter [bacterium]MDE0288026.1 putative sulfate exporter family transporter [bacterium]MDE0437581.1 putative sulfate exporter family transporter [bacterium]
MDRYTAKPTSLRSEDWTAVWLGAGLILLVLVGVRPAIPVFSWSTGGFGQTLSWDNLAAVLLTGVLLLGLSAAGVRLMGSDANGYLLGFPAVFALAWASRLIAGNAVLKQWGISYVIVALVIGLLISNLAGVPSWLRDAIRTEYYIKAGLVILGTNIVFGEILQAGLLGVAQALVVILAVWYFCYWMSKRLRVDDEFATMLASAVSICGVSAAIATCGAIAGDRKKLSYVTSLVLIVAVPMTILMPWAVKWLGMSPIVGGAWIGGTIDTSGAVVAAGEILGDSALNAAVIVKFSQNALLGLAAFAISLWWAFRAGAETGARPTARVIWDRFPKFVLGFIVASLLFSFVLGEEVVASTGALLKGLRTWWFALAFLCIGLETRFRDLVSMDQGRPALAFLAGQSVNILWTLLVATVLFGGGIFAVPNL